MNIHAVLNAVKEDSLKVKAQEIVNMLGIDATPHCWCHYMKVANKTVGNVTELVCLERRQESKLHLLIN
jgi:hypothetical protein